MQKRKKQSDTASREKTLDVDKLASAVHRANNGDKSAIAAVRQMLKDFPSLAIDIMQGDLAKQAETKLVNITAGEQFAFREALFAKLDALRNELGGPHPSPMERLLVERVVACWLQMYAADAISAQAGKTTFAEGEYLQRRQEGAHRRYLSAIKMLAVVRRLALPIRVDLNVAGSLETKSTESATTTRQRWLPEYSKN